jgi:hypothetical protein
MKNKIRIGLLSGLILWLATAPGLMPPSAEAGKLTRCGRKTGEKIDAGIGKFDENLKDEPDVQEAVFIEPARRVNKRYIQPVRAKLRHATKCMRGSGHSRNGRFELGSRAQQRIQEKISQQEAGLMAQLAQLQTQWGCATKAQRVAFLQAQLKQLQQLKDPYQKKH